MGNLTTLSGAYWSHASRHVSNTWHQICGEHEEEFPTIHECCPGTFNVLLKAEYLPPDEEFLRQKAKDRGDSVGRYIDGNHVSPYARVIKINGKPVEAWIYRGGHRDKPVLELLSRQRLADYLGLVDGAPVQLTIEEVALGTRGMPAIPPNTPGG